MATAGGGALGHVVAWEDAMPVARAPKLIFGLHDDLEVGDREVLQSRLLELKDVSLLERRAVALR